jgi:hypothetical protein
MLGYLANNLKKIKKTNHFWNLLRETNSNNAENVSFG